MEELQSVGVGLALGLVLVSALTLFPGNSSNYSNSDACTSDEHNAQASPTSSKDSNLSASVKKNADKQKLIADVDQAAQRVKIQKLQELLGMKKDKVQELIDRAKKEAVEAATTPSNVATSTSYGTWLDRGFFAGMLALLAWVLWTDYSIDVLSVFAQLLPREAEVVRQIGAVPQDLLAVMIALWG